MLVAEALAPALPNVQWILPQSPERPVTYHEGQYSPSWFDIARLPPDPNEFDEPVIMESIGLIEGLISSQVQAGRDPRKILLVGFSQGAALSMMVALSTSHNLGGVVSLSGWVPPRARPMLHARPSLPILWCHGTTDKEIPLSFARDGEEFLRNSLGFSGPRLQLRVYDGLEHTTNTTELEDVVSWLRDIVGEDS